MKKRIVSMFCISVLALNAFWCDPGDDGDLVAFLVDLPEGVKDVEKYGDNLCFFVMDYVAKHGIEGYYHPAHKPTKKKQGR